ncbi:FG-GAP repeat domain-containing protein [Streptomyces sp. NBC_01198]|uniref:FG-GAP repeat domain-containing protein n=1 Tax=Streptomyces sp. NBC_01198 TaxID=2903769 RepID=UPI002E124DF5|nr:VCBS repeat-containing protein [Streptomyces sp. NBC_01198]
MFRISRAPGARRSLAAAVATAAALGVVGLTSPTATALTAVGTSGRDLPGDLNGDGTNDIWTTDSSGLLLTYAGLGDGRFAAATSGGGTFTDTSVTTRGDWGQDGHNDLVTLEPGPQGDGKVLWVRPNDGTGTLATAVDGGPQRLSVECPAVTGPSDENPEGCTVADDHWHDADQVVAPGDLNGDDAPDLLVKEGSSLWVYYGDRASKRLDMHGAPVLVGASGWNGETVVAPGDLNGDGLPDLLLRDDATGGLSRVYGAAGSVAGILDPTSWGSPGARVAVGTGPTAAAYPVLASSGDITGDGVPDLWGRAANNAVTGWPGRVSSGDWTGTGRAFSISSSKHHPHDR